MTALHQTKTDDCRRFG